MEITELKNKKKTETKVSLKQFSSRLKMTEDQISKPEDRIY